MIKSRPIPGGRIGLKQEGRRMRSSRQNGFSQAPPSVRKFCHSPYQVLSKLNDQSILKTLDPGRFILVIESSQNLRRKLFETYLKWMSELVLNKDFIWKLKECFCESDCS